MSDLISKSVLIESMIYCEDLKGRKTIEAFAKLVKEQPEVDAEPVRYGEWIECQTNNGYYEYSACGRLHNKFHQGKTNFCPNCGADMRKKVT